MKQKSYVLLDVVRGLAMASVFFTHWAGWTMTGPDAIPSAESLIHTTQKLFHFVFWTGCFSHPGVFAFIVLSGFVIHFFGGMDAGDLTAKDWLRWYRKRLIRLLPVYWICSLAGVITLVLMQQHPGLVPAYALNDNQSSWGAVNVVALFLLLDPLILAPRHGLGNGPLSTVEFLIWLYLLYPCVVYGIRKIGRTKVMMLACGMYTAGILVKHAFFKTAHPMALGMMISFVFWYIGVYFADMLRAGKGGDGRVLNWWTALGLMAAFFCLSHLTKIEYKTYFIIYATSFLFVLFLAVVLYVGTRREMAEGFIPNRFLAGLSKLALFSYSLFAIHTPVIIITQMVNAKYLLDGYFFQRIAPMLASLLCAVVLYLCIEAPFHRLARRQVRQQGQRAI